MSIKELPVIVEKTETGERQPGLIAAYKRGSPYKIVLSNIFGQRTYDYWHGDKRGFIGYVDTYRSWDSIKRSFEQAGGFPLYGGYKVYPIKTEVKPKSKFKEIEL